MKTEEFKASSQYLGPLVTGNTRILLFSNKSRRKRALRKENLLKPLRKSRSIRGLTGISRKLRNIKCRHSLTLRRFR